MSEIELLAALYTCFKWISCLVVICNSSLNLNANFLIKSTRRFFHVFPHLSEGWDCLPRKWVFPRNFHLCRKQPFVLEFPYHNCKRAKAKIAKMKYLLSPVVKAIQNAWRSKMAIWHLWHIVGLLNSEYQVKITIQTFIKYVLPAKVRANCYSTNITKVQETG